MIFAAFYADVPGKQSRAAEFAHYARIGEKFLAATTPNSRYVLLTDRATASLVENYVETAVFAPDDAPLMLKVMLAQQAFLEACNEYVVLGDVDAIANRDLTHATADNVGLAITTKSDKFNFRINNLAYVRDCELGAWFLDRAIAILKTWPPEKQHWDGDQEAWEAALGDYPRRRPPHRLYLAGARGPIDLLPCDTHNCPAHRHGAVKQTQRDAFVVHFKGPRKRHMAAFARLRLSPDVAAAATA